MYNWASIRLDAASEGDEPGSFTAGYLTREGGAPCTIRASREGLMLHVPARGVKDVHAKVHEYKCIESLHIEGFLILRGELGNLVSHLAIPTESAQMLGALVIAQYGSFETRKSSVPKDIGRCLHLELNRKTTQAQGTTAVFPLAIPVDVPAKKQPVSLVLSDRLRRNGGTFTAQLLLPDSYNPSKDRKGTVDQSRFELMIHGGDESKKSAGFGRDERVVPVVWALPEGTRSIECGFSMKINSGFPLLESAVISE